MRTFRVLALLAAATLSHGAVRAQAPVAEATFDVVSVKPHVAGDVIFPGFRMMTQRPDGGLTMSRVPVAMILSVAYQPMSTADMVGLPEWATRDYYDISATSSLTNPTPEQRTAMVRAMLADRFHLVAHRERREVLSFDLLPTRNDGKFGAGLVKSDTDCDAMMAARRKEAETAARAGGPPPPPQLFDPNAPPPCMFVGMPTGLKGELTLGNLAAILRQAAGRVVVDKTGLSGYYRVNLTFALMPIQGPGAPPPSDDVPSVFTAVREQLGLKLEPSRTERDVLVIDRLERPTEN